MNELEAQMALVGVGIEEIRKQDRQGALIEASQNKFVNSINDGRVRSGIIGTTISNPNSVMDILLSSLQGKLCDIYFKSKGDYIRGVTLLAFDENHLLVSGQYPLDESRIHTCYTEFAICRSDIKMISENIPTSVYRDRMSEIMNSSRYRCD